MHHSKSGSQFLNWSKCEELALCIGCLTGERTSRIGRFVPNSEVRIIPRLMIPAREQSLRLLQIERLETLGEPAIDGGEQIADLILSTLIAPQPGHAHCGSEFPGLCLLLARDRRRVL